MPELLAPAGGPEQLRAAVENGADAVYLGAKAFNARAGATNFNDDELRRGIEYAHGRGVSVYLTMNTLVGDGEMAAAVDAAGGAYLAGADALIVQDLGLARVLHTYLPQFPLHMSTQGTVLSLEGIQALALLGFSRFILARELPMERVAAIAQASPVPVEVFVHGALCVCYSGQCQMSSMIGARSGNRGRCAQPCRLPYSLGNRSGSLLSPKDLCALDHLPDLVSAGVAALKIEGRLKSPEYVAVVTDIYRRTLDRIAMGLPTAVSQEDSTALAQVFNRGFTTGWLGGARGEDLSDAGAPGHRGLPVGRVLAQRGGLLELELTAPLHLGDSIEVQGSGMLVTYLQQYGSRVDTAAPGRAVVGDLAGSARPGDAVAKTADKALTEHARRSFEGIHKRVPIHGRFIAAVGRPLSFQAWDDEGHSAFAHTEEPAEVARTQPLNAEAVREQLDKTGPWPFTLADCEITVDSIAAAPKSALNGLRREALDALLVQRERRTAGRETGPWAPSPVQKAHPAQPQLSVVLTRWRPELVPVLAEVPRVFVPLDDWLSGTLPANVCPRIPFYTDLQADWPDAVAALRERRPALALAGSAGHLATLRQAGVAAVAGYTLNAYNARTLQTLAALGFAGATLSHELTLTQIQSMEAAPLELEAAVYGRLPLMVTRHCVLGRNRAGCSACTSGSPVLTDRRGASFPLAFDRRACVCTILNGDVLAVPQLAAQLGRAGVSWLRLYIHDETPETVAGLLAQYAAAARGELVEAPSGKGFTKGHYFRGV